MTELEQIKLIAEKGCAGVFCSDCILEHSCGNSGKLKAKSVLDLLSYDSDLSKCKVGDWVWTTQSGWCLIEKVYEDVVLLSNATTYTFRGKFSSSNKCPTAFIKPPLCFNPGPRPEPVCPSKKGERVLVSDHPDNKKVPRYFAEYRANSEFPYFCFANGGDEWSSNGEMHGWKCCEAYKETTHIREGAVLPDGGVVACQYNGYWLVVAPATQRGSNIRFGLYKTDTSLTAVTDVAIPDPQDGKLNTDVLTSSTYNTIHDGHGSVGCPPAEFCRALSADYFLPNKEELLAIQAVAADIDAADTSGGADTFESMGIEYIWTSTEYNSNRSWVVRASNGGIDGHGRYNGYWVVPVRRIAI